MDSLQKIIRSISYYHFVNLIVSIFAEILSLPSKRVALLAAEGSFIARSDSNGEDQEGFAGAGLYDSIPVPAAEERILDYTTEKLLWDPEVSLAVGKSRHFRCETQLFLGCFCKSWAVRQPFSTRGQGASARLHHRGALVGS